MRRYALRCLQRMEQDWHMGKQDVAMRMSILLRQVACYYYPKRQVAGLTGTPWLNFLEESCHKRIHANVVRWLPYQAKGDVREFFIFCKAWIQQQGK